MTPAQVLKRESAKARSSALEEAMALQIRAAGLPKPVREHSPIPGRRWRIDFAWPLQLVALEVEGGIYSGGRHTRPNGFNADAEKYNALAIAGWVVLRVTTDHIKSGQALAWLQKVIR